MRPIPYGRQAIDTADIREVVKILKSDWLTQGPKIKEFEDALCKYTGAKYAVAVSSGTAALHIACLSAGIGHRDEVIISPITFAASANSVLYCGGKPVFSDIQEDTVNINPLEIRKKISGKTRALMPVHFAGHPCDMEEIGGIARKYNLAVIEDACHALGAEYKGSKIGACKYSDMTVFSFHPVKSITTGEGGAVLTNSKSFYEKLLGLRAHGITKDFNKFKKKGAGFWHYEMQELGFNYRITDFQCALGLSQLKKLDSFIKRRREIRDIYNEALKMVSGLVLPVEKEYVHSSWHIYCLRLKNSAMQKKVYEGLRNSGILAQVHYIPVYRHPYYSNLPDYKGVKCPLAEKYYSLAVTLPLFPGLTVPEIKYVISKVKELSV